MIVSLPLGLHPSPLGPSSFSTRGLYPSPLGPSSFSTWAFSLEEAEKALELNTTDINKIKRALEPENTTIVINAGQTKTSQKTYKDSVSLNIPGPINDLNLDNFKKIQNLLFKCDPLFIAIWKWKGLEQARLHLWKVAKEALLANVQRFKCRLTDDDGCPQCANNSETVIHLCRNCLIAWSVWIKASSITLNYLWKCCNEVVFDNKHHTSDNISIVISVLTHQSRSSMHDEMSLASGAKRGLRTSLISWKPPKANRWKLNYDGARSC
ncbi:hypothetical protein D0Y65_026466 [Glycine soja]|uniref:Uncharacterized protein n=1 Tax=Glycine soja TaxID=3848 RepID=A0A445IK39_GLYSO|nr:hypothetical protein D0Y65_026466 [Glycine soja]